MRAQPQVVGEKKLVLGVFAVVVPSSPKGVLWHMNHFPIWAPELTEGRAVNVGWSCLTRKLSFGELTCWD